MRPHQNRRRLLLSVAAGLPVPLRKPRQVEPPPPRPTSLQETDPRLRYTTTLTYDPGRWSLSLNRVVTCTYDSVGRVSQMGTVRNCYNFTPSTQDTLGSVVTYTYDVTARRPPEPGQGD